MIEQRGDPRELGPWLDGHDVADVYDAWCASLETLDTEGAVAALATLAGDGPVLELAIGTGRLALPLAARGLEVQGIDASAEMVAKLHEKPGGDQILVTIGDLVDVAVSGSFSLVFIVFNTFFGLRSADDQARCFRNVRAHLTEGGLFVIESSVPDLKRFAADGEKSVRRLDFNETTVIDTATHDRAAQRVDQEHIVMRADGTSVVPFSVRYAYPDELDNMAEAAGMRLLDRWGGWRREPFSDPTISFISIYQAVGA